MGVYGGLVPYAKLTLEGSAQLDAGLLRGTVIITVVLIKLSLPLTQDIIAKAHKAPISLHAFPSNGLVCSGAYIKAEAMGGKIVGKFERVAGLSTDIDWSDPWNSNVERKWEPIAEVTFYKWDSLASFGATPARFLGNSTMFGCHDPVTGEGTDQGGDACT